MNKRSIYKIIFQIIVIFFPYHYLISIPRPLLSPQPVGINEGCCDYGDLYASLTTLNNQMKYCSSTPIFGATTITQSGSYCLNNFINGTITIAASDVTLNLNSYGITAGQYGISINNGFNNIVIKNGTISNTDQEAIRVESGCSNIFFSNIVCNSCALNGAYILTFNGTSSNPIDGAYSKNLTLSKGPGGILYNNTANILLEESVITDLTSNSNPLNGVVLQSDNSSIVSKALIKDCRITNLTSLSSLVNGILINRAKNICIDSCSVQQLSGNYANAYYVFNSTNNILKNCSAIDIIDNNTQFSATLGAKGFYIQNSTSVLLENVIIYNIQSAYNYSYAIRAFVSPKTIINKGLCQNIISLTGIIDPNINYGPNFYTTPPSSYGLSFNQSPYSHVENYHCTNIVTNGLASYGFHIANSPYTTILKGHVDTLLASQASWAYRIFQGSSNTLVADCVSMNLTVTAAPYIVNQLDGAIGFELESVNNVHIKDCISLVNSAPIAGARAAGFNASTADLTSNVVLDNFYTSTSTAVTPDLGNGIFLGPLATAYTVKNAISKDNTGSGIVINTPKSILYNSEFSNSVNGVHNNIDESTIYDTVMTNCVNGLLNSANIYTIYNCSATTNTTNYAGNTANLNIVPLGGQPVVGNNISG